MGKKVDFGLEYKESRENLQTTQGAGFTQQNANIAEEFRAEITETFESLANATITDKYIVQNLTTVDTWITDNLMEVSHSLTKVLNTIATPHANINGHNGSIHGRWGYEDQGSCDDRGGRERITRLYNTQDYCPTNYYNIHGDHKSEICNIQVKVITMVQLLGTTEGGTRNIIIYLVGINHKIM